MITKILDLILKSMGSQGRGIRSGGSFGGPGQEFSSTILYWEQMVNGNLA